MIQSKIESNNKRIAKNTAFLYGRTILILLVSLYTSRIVLNTLGVEDYGIYQAVGGVVAMFSVISGAMSNAISRFLTYELGTDNTSRLNRVFCTSVNIQILISLFIFVLCEIFGMWFLNAKMDIPEGRIGAANWVLHCSLISFVIGLISTPYNASIIAHEHMNTFAYVSIIEAFLKLAIVFLLIKVSIDKLISYSILLVIVALIIRIIYGIYCKHHFSECKYHYIYDKKIFKEMIGFAGWNFLSNGAYVFNTQGINLLVNTYFGVMLNAARGIATQVDGAVMQFINNFTMAINPQITKSYAAQDRDRLFYLICKGARFSYLLLLIFTLPLLFETDFLLTIWLKNVPEKTVIFVRLALIGSLIHCLGNTGITACMATGVIRKYVLCVTAVGIMGFFGTWIVYSLSFPVESTYWVYIIVYTITLIVRLELMKTMLDFHPYIFYRNVIIPIILPTLLSLIMPMIIIHTMQQSIIRFILDIIVCVLFSCIFIYLLGLTKGEKNLITNKISHMLAKLKQ